MPRDSSGTYALPAGNPVSSGTTIESAWANDTMGDIGNEMTDSLSRTGDGGMLAPLKVPDGSAGAPSYTFLNGPTTGMYFSDSSDEIRFAVNAGEKLSIGTAAVTVPAGTLMILGQDPNGLLQATTKQYTDTADALKVNKSGDTMTGVLTSDSNSIGFRVQSIDDTGGFVGFETRWSNGNIAANFVKSFTADTAAITNRSNSGTVISGLTFNNTGGRLLFNIAPTITGGTDITNKTYVDGVSDIRAKENIVPFSGATALVQQMQFSEYDLNAQSHKPGEHSIGLMAHELKTIMPELVHTHLRPAEDGSVLAAAPEDLEYVDYQGLLSVALQSIKELTARIEVLETP